MAPLQHRIFTITELLESILLNLNLRDLLFNAQCVCKRWKAVIAASPKIQQTTFLKANPALNSDGRITLHRRNQLVTSERPGFLGGKGWGFVKSYDLRCGLKGIPLSLWNRENASWRKMHIAQPPVTKLHWMTRRIICGTGAMPMVLAEFAFPDGIRLGDYYDLIVSRGNSLLNVAWPDLTAEDKVFAASTSLGRWGLERQKAADLCGALLVYHHVLTSGIYTGDIGAPQEFPTHLEKYHNMLRRLEIIRVQGKGTERIWPQTDITFDSSVEAMNMFLEATQAPTKNKIVASYDHITRSWPHEFDFSTLSYTTAFQQEDIDTDQ